MPCVLPRSFWTVCTVCRAAPSLTTTECREVVDCVVIGQPWEGDTRVVLFVQLAGGEELDAELVAKIRAEVRTGCTPRHVPAVIHAVQEIPYTLSGKKVELAVRAIVLGEKVENKSALKNPEALDSFHPDHWPT